MSCPDPAVLSQLVDQELPAAEAADVRAHVARCSACRDRLGRLDGASAAGRILAGRVSRPSPGPSGDGCLGPEDLAAWAERTLPDVAFEAVETHLRACDACLAGALDAAQTMTRLEATPALPVPETLKARVASRWSTAEAEVEPGGVVLRLARAGLALVERHVVAPLLEVEVWALPAPAVRAEADATALGFRIRAPRAEIRATVVPEGGGVTVRLALLDDAERALGGQRVSLRRHGRAMYAARTDADGTVELPRLDPGVYEVSCPEIDTAFRLDLRT
jgi:anti-sigma factor RsiW